jgi:DNA-binding NarL/FixJ family response regulator
MAEKGAATGRRLTARTNHTDGNIKGRGNTMAIPSEAGAIASNVIPDGHLRAARTKYRILIVDDHTLMREGLRALLNGDEELVVCGMVDNGRDSVRTTVLLKPDLVLMDLAMPQMDGLSAIRELRLRSPGTKIVVLTMHKTEEHIRAALQAGASGYMLKDACAAELLMAIHSVLSGKTFITPAVADRIVIGYLHRDGSAPAVRSLADTLTSRERQVLKLIAEGRRNRDIAECLFVSVKTVEKHRANLMGKLNLHNTASLTTYAMENVL